MRSFLPLQPLPPCPFGFLHDCLRTCKPRHLPPDMLKCPIRTFVPREATEGKSQAEAGSRTCPFLAQLAAGPPKFEKRMRNTVRHVSSIMKCSRAPKTGVGGVTNFPPQRDLRLHSLEPWECGLDEFLKCYRHQGIKDEAPATLGR